MRGLTVLGALGAALAAGAACAAPSVAIRGAAVRVVVIPEARSDVSVAFIKTNPRLPLKVSQLGEKVFVDGDIGHRPHGCLGWGGRRGVGIWGRGRIAYEDLPQIVVHAPMAVEVAAGDAVFGAIGRGDSVDLANHGCGDWTIGNVRGHLRLSQSGSGDANAGAAGSAEISVAGSGDVSTRQIAAGLSAVVRGSGDVVAASVSGPLDVNIAGSGDVRAGAGQVTRMNVAVAGSGDVTFGGVAQSLDASVAGSGDIRVAQVVGSVNKHVMGSGEVTIGRQATAVADDGR
ncbi:MAG: DUF2807 domain-containing protein [Caulobacteraceae bacterium]|nr:DUF2807 domain-containing protein [Caulobacteraceae bacterium]